MKLNKEKFLKTELGLNLKECITAWDRWITEYSELTDFKSSSELIKACSWCQAQWEVYETVIQQFYGVKYYFIRNDKYFALVTKDETDWLFKIER